MISIDKILKFVPKLDCHDRWHREKERGRGGAVAPVIFRTVTFLFVRNPLRKSWSGVIKVSLVQNAHTIAV